MASLSNFNKRLQQSIREEVCSQDHGSTDHVVLSMMDSDACVEEAVPAEEPAAEPKEGCASKGKGKCGTYSVPM